MSEIERSLVLEHLGTLEQYVERLAALRHYRLEDFESDVVLSWAVERGLQLAIQCVLDVSSHILAAQGLARPEDYQQTILALGEHGVVPQEFAERIAKMAGFRNILVHLYLGIDWKIVYAILQNNLPDFKEFANYIVQYLERH